MIILITAVVFIVLFFRILNKGVIHKKAINIGLSSINKSYKELFTIKDVKVKFLQCFMIIFSELFSFIIIYELIMNYSDKYISLTINNNIKLILIVVFFLMTHYSMGYLMLISSKMYSFLYRSEDESLKFDFLLTYFLTTTYLMVLIMFPKQLYNNVLAGIFGIAICYFLNLKILLNIMKNPKNIKFSKEDSGSFSRIFFAAILISFMIIINLYISVCLVHLLGNGGFSNNPSYFDLFYYTVTTFTTIGFGDIIPLTIPAKFIAIVISGTSVICLTIFLGSIFSYRSKQ